MADPYAELGRSVCPDIERRLADEEHLLPGAVFATRNEEIGEINDAITDRFP